MAESKPKPAASLRTPGPKKKLGLTVPPALRLPHDDLIVAQREPEVNEQERSLTSHTSMTSQTSQTNRDSEKASISPERDFTKVANSIGRQAVPAGLFTGKSKQLYDCLYSMTRGAIVPTRSVRISRPKLMAKAAIGSRVTFDANIDRLISVGLISVRHIAGEHEGNEYTVHLPEEATFSLTSLTSQTTMTSQTSHAQFLDRLVSLETSQTRHTSSSLESTGSRESKTSFKTKDRSDDEPAAQLGAKLSQVERDLTGKNGANPEQWGELADVIAAELKIAAARTTVSNVPAFLAEHLRRRLWKLDKKQALEQGRELPDQAAVSSHVAAPVECPDCKGSGWWYPEGQDRGVTKCKHSKLPTGS